ncbi:uncharacterized protein [Coffea arabica]|uniref:Uncharacterized protein n=1 Tax=Coffea arabica TaxID=13443 RepID=A0ABM4W398_COFAR
MPKKLKSSSAFLQKVSRLLRVHIFITRMRKSINIPRIISLKKSRKIKKFMLLRHYKCGYAQEYQLSPSNSPFLRYNCRKPINKRRYKDLYSILFIGKCLELSGEDDECSIDERAEKFIERFYEEMRIQRQELLMQFNPLMLDDDC